MKLSKSTVLLLVFLICGCCWLSSIQTVFKGLQFIKAIQSGQVAEADTVETMTRAIVDILMFPILTILTIVFYRKFRAADREKSDNPKEDTRQSA